jgi:hypothetical protein
MAGFLDNSNTNAFGGGGFLDKSTAFNNNGFGFIQSGVAAPAQSSVQTQQNQAFGWTPGTDLGTKTEQQPGVINRNEPAKPSEWSEISKVAAPVVKAAGGAIASSVSSMLGGTAGNIASTAGSALGGAGAGMLLGGFVFGTIAGEIIGKALEHAPPHGRFRSTGLNNRSNYEDGVIYTSKLGNIGMADTATKYVSASDLDPVFQAMVTMDNKLYEYFDDTARQAIKNGFEWNSNMTNPSILRERYGQMLTFAARHGSEGAKQAVQTIDDAAIDYGVAQKSIAKYADTGLAEKKRAEYNARKAALDSRNDSSGDRGLMGKFGAADPALTKTAREAARGVGTHETQDVFAVADKAYNSYKANGGKMGKEMFWGAFGDRIESSVNGTYTDLSRSQSYVDFGKKIAPKLREKGIDPGLLGKSQGTMDDETYFALYIGGLAGYSYNDIVSGAASQGGHAQATMPAEDQSLTGLNASGDWSNN